MHTPSGTFSAQPLRGTPVMMFRLCSVQFLPTWLFSTHTSALSAVSENSISAFCTNTAGCGFTLWCIIARWSVTQFCTASVDEIISRLVP